ncbi:MAG TPA: DUF1015 domain-containing protein [Candidatus Acidoferrum sp.]|nr:DUF1015 domain-containing protein [Candidatus Acidoferrum sp.]
MTVKERLFALGISVPDILLPAPGVPLETFSVVACDQYTSRPAYWERAKELAGDAPSALNMILPEAYLREDNSDDIARIHKAMRACLQKELLRPIGEGFVLVRRQTTTGWRRGLVLALDLERYDYSPASKSLIRATESTIASRLPARVKIRQGAPLELPHIMVLVDDPGNTLIGPLDAAWDTLQPLYDFELMQGAGRLQGRKVEELEPVCEALEGLAKVAQGLLFAMGDGNHSLASARLHWEYRKAKLTAEQRVTDPARYALVEIVNLHDPALAFEPIHRVLFGVDKAAFDLVDPENLPPLQQLQPALDKWLAAHPKASIDYIHGEKEARELGGAPGNIALILPEFEKSTLFEIVRKDGALVRKSFSMGEAPDKRHYLEAKLI